MHEGEEEENRQTDDATINLNFKDEDKSSGDESMHSSEENDTVDVRKEFC